MASLERGEPLSATAAPTSRFLLLEETGAWGPALLRCYRLPEKLRKQVAVWQAELGVRPLLIRRHGRSAPTQRRVFVVNTAHGWAETALVDDLAEVARWDLGQIGTPEGVGLELWDDPLLLVCTHGRHDACCAEFGRPVAGALAAEFGDRVWESSHLGGDRFAANLLMLPDGHTYGRLAPESAVEVVNRHLAGEITLEHHRGRNGIPPAAQAAERAVRAELGEFGVDRLSSRVLRQDETSASVQVRVGRDAYLVEVTISESPSALLTCSAERPKRAKRFEVT